MIIKPPPDIKSSEITHEETYAGRRKFLKGAALIASAAGTGWLYRQFAMPGEASKAGEKIDGIVATGRAPVPVIHEPLTPLRDVTHYNNFYEFSTDKQAVAKRAMNFATRPWTVQVGGLAHRPRTFDIDDLLRISPPEERIYRHRCVEGWSMVVPWIGLPLAKLLELVQPMGSARFVTFESLADPKRMPNVGSSVLDWPYVEGLRLDEAMHPLTILAVGLYGATLPPQNGAPLRLVVPWKYGFKGIKSIVRINLVETMPPTTWNRMSPKEYGFYSNVNPDVDHPRWSQRTELRLGESERRDTLLFNGYADQVAGLYAGMNLMVNF